MNTNLLAAPEFSLAPIITAFVTADCTAELRLSGCWCEIMTMTLVGGNAFDQQNGLPIFGDASLTFKAHESASVTTLTFNQSEAFGLDAISMQVNSSGWADLLDPRAEISLAQDDIFNRLLYRITGPSLDLAETNTHLSGLKLGCYKQLFFGGPESLVTNFLVDFPLAVLKYVEIYRDATSEDKRQLDMHLQQDQKEGLQRWRIIAAPDSERALTVDLYRKLGSKAFAAIDIELNSYDLVDEFLPFCEIPEDRDYVGWGDMLALHKLLRPLLATFIDSGVLHIDLEGEAQVVVINMPWCQGMLTLSTQEGLQVIEGTLEGCLQDNLAVWNQGLGREGLGLLDLFECMNHRLAGHSNSLLSLLSFP